MIRYWLTTKRDERFVEKVSDINALYKQAPELGKRGEVVVSTDEMTGVQALERKHPGLPMGPGHVERLKQNTFNTRHPLPPRRAHRLLFLVSSPAMLASPNLAGWPLSLLA